MKKLEVIAWTLFDAINIEKSGADRIELVVDLERGGLTPPLKLVKDVLDNVTIPVRVMVRETDESFIYDKSTMKIHLDYIGQLRELNLDGIVFGSLTNDNKINFEQLEQVIEAKGNMKLTFHRAFDELDPKDAIEEFDKLSTYAVDTLLTSGTMSSALEGKTIIKLLIDKHTMEILPGKSISIENAKEIIEYTNADIIHIGYAVRTDGTGSSPISIDKIKELIKEVNND